MPTVCIYQRFMPPDPSGAGKQAVTLAHAIRDAGWSAMFLTDQRGDDRLEDDRLGGFPVARVRAAPPEPSYPQIAAYWGRIGAALLKWRARFDIVHVHSADFHQVGAVPVARMLGKPVVVRSSISREFSSLRASKSGRVQAKILAMVDAFVVLSERLRREYEEAGLPMSKLNLIPNGVDTDTYHPVDRAAKLALRQELGLPCDRQLLVFHGVFLERKSLHWLVEAMEGHLEALDASLLLVGGPARDESRSGYARRLIEQIGRSPGRDRIIVREHDPAVHRYLKAADAYVLPSTGEGLPNALLEAMAVGLVPFATRTSGSEDVIEDGVSGFLFEPGDATSLLRLVDRAFGAEAIASIDRIRQAAVARVRDRFSIRAVGARYVNLYGRLVA